MSEAAVAAVESTRGNRKRVIGRVVSDKMDKTRVVEVIEHQMHPLYKKFIKRSTKFHMHDEKNESKLGDRVQIIETRPMSKLKRWRLINIIDRAI